MQPECKCPVCGSTIDKIPVTILPERGMIVTDKGFAVLTGHEMQLLQRLAEIFPRVLTKEAAMSWLYQIDHDREPDIKIIDVFICKIRKKTDPLGLRIDTVWGRGYALGIDGSLNIVREEAA